MLGRSVHAGSAGGGPGARTTPSPGFARVLPRRETQGRGQPRAPSPRAEPSTTQVPGREVGGRLSTAFQKQELQRYIMQHGKLFLIITVNGA